MRENIFPVNNFLSRAAKEKLLQQKGRVIWLTGLSGSGKSTIALELEKQLRARGFITQVLDGDNIRAGLNKDLGFSEADRVENVRRIAEVALLFTCCGILTICPVVSPYRHLREMAKTIIGEDDFMEVYVSAPLQVCEERDVKGLYSASRKGAIKNFTGVNSVYEVPENPDLIVDSDSLSVDDCVKFILTKFGKH